MYSILGFLVEVQKVLQVSTYVIYYILDKNNWALKSERL